MIKHLKNPRTELYCRFKKEILEEDFPWYFKKESYGDSHPEFFSHAFIIRPHDDGKRFPVNVSNFTDYDYQLVKEIFEYNNIKLNCIFRMNLNLVYPQSGKQTTPLHVDHEFTHQNFLLYLTSAGGRVVVGNESYEPKEDDVITFGGLPHYIELPKKSIRIALVVTYF